MYTHRIAHKAKENQGYVSREVLWKCSSSSTNRDYDESHDVDPFTSKFVRDYVPQTIPQHPSNPEYHHGHLGKKTAITYKVPLSIIMKRNG